MFHFAATTAPEEAERSGKKSRQDDSEKSNIQLDEHYATHNKVDNKFSKT